MIPYAGFLYFAVLLFVAVPAVVCGLAGRWKRSCLVLATILMLGVQYGPEQTIAGGVVLRGVWLVLGYALAQYAVARAFLAIRRSGKRSLPFWMAIVLALLPLAAAKCVPLLSPGEELGFLGISYVTFRTVDVIINIHDALVVDLPPLQYLAFLLFFPTISSGPVDRYRRFLGDWVRQRSRADFLDDLDGAIQLIFRGLLYKFILAALIKTWWMDPVATGGAIRGIVLYMYAYSFYLFFDFAGYSAFAIGLSRLLGIHTPDNFNLPFLSRNIKEFWNRWHISLSWWFRDHVYSRFVFAATKGRWFRNRYMGSYIGFFLSMGLMGIWHGLAIHYLIYGLYHGTLLVCHDRFSRWNQKRKLIGDGWAWQAAAVAVTFQSVCFGLLIFSGRLG